VVHGDVDQELLRRRDSVRVAEVGDELVAQR
jgi:hypothetical protein